MDVETTTAIERLTARIDALGTSVRGDIDTMEITLRGEISTLRDEMRDGLEESRRHAVILNESTRDDIRLVAEAVAVLAVKVDALQR